MTEQLRFHFSLSCIEEGNGNPLQCPCLENPRDGGAWWAALWGRAESDTTEATQQQQQHSRLTHDVVIVSDEQGRDTATHIHVSILPQTTLPSRQEGSDLKLHNNHALLCFAQTSHDCPSHYLFSLARGGDGRGHVGGRGCYLVFLGISHVYRGILVITLLSIFLLLIFD